MFFYFSFFYYYYFLYVIWGQFIYIYIGNDGWVFFFFFFLVEGGMVFFKEKVGGLWRVFIFTFLLLIFIDLQF